LAGQPELRDRLNEAGLRQLKQRVTLRCEIGPFTETETAAYIAHRIKTAGGDAAAMFTRQAVMLIHERSRGIPRTISVLCDNALLTGFAMGQRPVNSQMTLEVIEDFDLGGARRARAYETLRVAPPRVEPEQQPKPVAAEAAAPIATKEAGDGTS